MARTRTIKPSFFTNEELAKLSPLTRLLFIGLWTQADREGRLEDRPRRLKAAILPFDRYPIEHGLQALVDGQFIVRYRTVDGLSIIQVRKFADHQSPHPKEESSVLPKYDESMTDRGADSKKTEVMHESSMTHASAMHKPSKRHASTMHESSMDTKSVDFSPLALTLTTDSSESNPPGPPSRSDVRPAWESDSDESVSAPVGAGREDEPKKSKGAVVIDLIRAGGVDVVMTSRDFGAVKRCSASAELIAEAFLAAHAGTWNPGGKGWLRDNLAVWAVCDRINGYTASKSNVRPFRKTSASNIMTAPAKREPTDEERREEAEIQQLMAERNWTRRQAICYLLDGDVQQGAS